MTLAINEKTRWNRKFFHILLRCCWVVMVFYLMFTAPVSTPMTVSLTRHCYRLYCKLVKFKFNILFSFLHFIYYKNYIYHQLYRGITIKNFLLRTRQWRHLFRKLRGSVRFLVESRIGIIWQQLNKKWKRILRSWGFMKEEMQTRLYHESYDTIEVGN